MSGNDESDENNETEDAIFNPYTFTELNSVVDHTPVRKNKKIKVRPLLTHDIAGNAQLIRELSKRTGYSRKSLDKVVRALRDIFEDAILYGYDIRIKDLFTLHHTIIPARRGVNAYKTRINPTGESVWEDFPETIKSTIRLSVALRNLNRTKNKKKHEEKLRKENEDNEI